MDNQSTESEVGDGYIPMMAGTSGPPTRDCSGSLILAHRADLTMAAGNHPPVLSRLDHVFIEDVHQTLVGHTLLC